MSAQSRDEVQARRPSTLEGEAAGPNYGTVSGERGDTRPLVNGTGGNRPAVPTGVSTAATAPASSTRTPGERVSETALGAPTRVDSGVGSRVEAQAQPPLNPQQPQQPNSQQGRQLEAGTRGLPLEATRETSQASHQQQQRLVSPSVSSMVQQRARESLLQHGAVEQVELHREVHVQQVDVPGEGHPHPSAEQGQSRTPAWWARMSEVLQRRVVSPMMEQVHSAGVGRAPHNPDASPTSVWHSQPSSPTDGGPQLIPQDLRQAMTSWTARPSLITPRPRRTVPAEDSSNASVNQEAVMEEVKRQVKLALDERESESRRLAEENRELRQLVMDLTGLRGGGQDLIVDGDMTASERLAAPTRPELRGSFAGEGGASSTLEQVRAPSGLPLQSQVPGGQGLIEQARAPPGLPLQSQVPGGQGLIEQARAPPGLPLQSQVPGGQGLTEQARAPPGLPLQSQVPGGQGLIEQARAPPGLPLQSQVPGGQGHLGSSVMPSGPQGHDQQFVSGQQTSEPVPGRMASSMSSGNPLGHDTGQVDSQKPNEGLRGTNHGMSGTSAANEAGEPSRTVGGNEEGDMVGHLHLLVQGMRQLQQLQIAKKEAPEVETMKGNIELPAMPELGDAAVEFNDWLYIAEQMLGSLTDSASAWFSESLRCARETYDLYQKSSAMDRLTISPVPTKLLTDPKYRLERRVLTLLLGAMPRGVKEDTITHRIESVTGVLYRLHVLYQPGGTAERTSILRHLEGAAGGEDPSEIVTKLRRWRRYLSRASEMDIAAPDSSILLRGLDTILAKVLERYPDVKFRLDLARNELRLSSSPTQESVLKYYQHALAELQQVNPSTTRKSPDNPKLKGANANAAGTGGSTSQPGSPKKGKGPCKFFMSDSGCKRGSSCPYTHEFLSKADRKQRCWTCGSTTHKQNECPTIGAKGSGKSPSGTLAPATNSSNASTPSPAFSCEGPSSGGDLNYSKRSS